MKRILRLLTPENVYVDYELAGLGSRFCAIVIDTIIQGVLILMVVVGMILAGIGILDLAFLGSYFIAIAIVVLFLIMYGYFIFFEMILNGQTLGKKIMKIRVLKRTGEPVGALESILRNVFRVLYIIPLFYFLDSLLIMYSKDYKRVGDFVSNTIVVKIRENEKLITIDDLLDEETFSEFEPLSGFRVTNEEYIILKDFMAKKDTLGKRKETFIYNLNKYFMKKFDMDTPYDDPYDFFNDIIKYNSGI